MISSAPVNFFCSGNILHIDDFEFEDSSKKDKILIVLYADDKDAYVIQSLTTSKNRTSNQSAINHGCNISNSKLHFYFFDKNNIVGKKSDDSDFKFDLDTFVYFLQNVKKIPVVNFLKYRSNIRFLAALNKSELKSFILCIVGSYFVGLEEQKILKTYLDNSL